jgi:hypothetical protein
MREKDISNEILRLKTKLTGNLLEDMQTQQEIYELKKMLKPEIVNQPELDDDDCLSCGA